MSQNLLKDKLLAIEREKYGKWTGEDCGIDKPKPGRYRSIESEEDIQHLKNAMATCNYPLGISDCEVVGINGDCGPNCPVKLRGECKEED